MLRLIYSFVTYLRDKSFSQKIIRVSRNSKLYTRNLSLETRFSKASSIEDRVSSRDCQLTFERYCMLLLSLGINPTLLYCSVLDENHSENNMHDSEHLL